MQTAKDCGKCSSGGLVEQMVGCDMCDIWFHAGCVDETETSLNPDKTWKCSHCAKEDVEETTSRHTSKSARSSASSRARRELLLQQLEEQRALKLKQRAEEDEIRKKRAEEDEAFLQQKLDLILEDDNESKSSRLSSRESRKKVVDWLNDGQGRQPVATGSSYNGAIPQLPIAQQFASSSLNRAIRPAHPASKPATGFPTSSSTPQSGKAIGILGKDCPQASISQQIEPISSFTSIRQDSIENSTSAQPYLVSMGRQSLPFHTLSHIPRMGNVLENCISKSIADTKVTFSGPFGEVVPSKCQTLSGPMPTPRNTIITSVVGQSTEAIVVPPSVNLPYASVSGPSTSVAAFYPQANQRASPINATANPNGVESLRSGVRQYGASQVGTPQQSTPSSAQLAARQVMSRELPDFAGDPQDWPLFSSSFHNSTVACGFTDAENLARLQRCLKGHALDSVKSRLLMPESVPHVMETLRKLYGRPEVLIHTLLRRLRSVPPPRTENLQSVITFGMAVRNLVDHMFVAQLLDHLCNPMLLHELVEKLPSTMKMQWSWYKRSQSDVNLATFGEFMDELVTTASDVTLPTEPQVQQSKSGQTGRDKQKLYVHVESTYEQAETLSTYGTPKSTFSSGGSNKLCYYCSNVEHVVADCPQFKSLDVDGRWKAIRSKGLCRTCLVPHRKWPCRSGKECEVDGCRFRHHELLHSIADAVVNRSSTGHRVSSNEVRVTQQNHHSTLSYCLFRYLPVTLEMNGKQVETFAFLDDGCQTTLMEAGLAADLDIAGPGESLWLGWTGNITREEKGSQRITVNISGSGLKSQYKLSNVRTVQKLQLQAQTFQYEEMKETYPHLRGLPLRSYFDAVPRLIIGIEHVQLLTALKVREGRSNEPVATKTRLGWCVYGKQAAGEGSTIERLHLHTVEQQLGNRELHDLLKQFFAVEEAAVATPIESADDSRARRILEQTTRRTDGRFETGLLWKYDKPVFPDSYSLAVRRLQCLEKRLNKDQELRDRVITLVRDYESKGYAHKITQDELESTESNQTWFLPLGVVRNPKKPEKVRLIWDAAARVHGLSFNDMLLKGPDMLTSLFAVLLRFRQRSIAVSGDIREMFHQIQIIPQDKQYQRFLFREHQDDEPQIYVMDVATFGATCSPCSSQFVKNKNAKDFESEFPEAAEAIINAHYVDDFLDSVDSVEKAVKLIQDVKHVHAQAGFEIRNFVSNSAEVLLQVGEPRNLQRKSLDLDGSISTERVLGMVWKPIEDVFTFDVILKEDLTQFLEAPVLPTKRQVLRLVMSLFDPNGFIAHFVVHGKILIQHIWRTGTEWDEEIALKLYEMWSDWIHLLKRLHEVEVPRCFFGEISSQVPANIQLHIFVDASELAYACVAYLRIVQAGTVRCVLVAAKTKVAPLKPLSIPRLELQACIIGCRLMETISAALNLNIEERYFWTDSTTALAWITSDSRRYHPYVAFRVGEILNSSNVDEWHYVPSRQNVADVATKWGNGPDLQPDSRWYVGEPFLYQPKSEWPKQVQKQERTQEELRAVFHLHRELPQPLIDVTRFSNWNRLLRTAAFVYRAVKRFRNEKICGSLTSDELLQGENLIWRQTQFQAYPDEYSLLEYNSQHPNEIPLNLEKCSKLYTESPFMDDVGVIRMNSRISAAPTAAYETKYPVILPKDHHTTRLLVDSYHRHFLHSNNNTVFNEVRQRFRVPQLRSVVKRISKECQHCKIRKAVSRSPMMAPLPAARLTPNIRAFSYTGVDYFGPLLVKQGRSLVKRWVALFTCLTIRAVHLEIVHSLSTQSCVMAIRRFISRRGAPAAFYSDNGTCFKGASSLLCEQIQSLHENCAVTFTNARTTWHFNPPFAPHMGGCWERMVRSVKTAMTVIAEHPRHPSDEVLETVVLEAEAIINSRPLTFVPLDDADQEALTPNHFLLYGCTGVVQPRSAFMMEGNTLRDSWKLSQYLADQFWRRWVLEYLPTLTRRTKWFKSVKPLEPGDIVYVVDENKRNGWLRGRIIEVLKGKDGQTRRAIVQTKDGLFTRAAVKLALLDIGVDRKQCADDGSPELHGRGNVKETTGQLRSVT